MPVDVLEAAFAIDHDVAAKKFQVCARMIMMMQWTSGNTWSDANDGSNEPEDLVKHVFVQEMTSRHRRRKSTLKEMGVEALRRIGMLCVYCCCLKP